MTARSRLPRGGAVLLALWIGSACGKDPDSSGPLPAGGKSGASGMQGASGSSGSSGTSGSGATGDGGSAGTSDASATGGSLGSFGSSGTGDAGVDVAPGVEVRWAEPSQSAVLRGTTRFHLVGRGFLNVEIKRDQITIATCTVSADHASAVADLDTTRLPNGAVTLTAHAWDSPPGQPFQYDDDAGPLTVSIDNPSGGIKQPFAVGSHWNELGKYASMRAGGIQMIRMDISWEHVQPSPGAFNWSAVDLAMTEAKNQNLQVLAVVGYTNDWASSGSGQPGEIHQYAPLESYDDEWGTFVQQVASRYGDQVAAWEIWNEPDHDNFLRMANGTWAYNHYPSESAVDKKRLEYKHLLEIALAQPALAGKTLTTSGFAEGGGYDTGFRAWLQTQSGFLNRFHIASFHTYGYPSYQRLVDVPASYRTTQSAIGKASWPFWITEHGINTTGVAAGTVKTYLIRSFATALAQPGVEKLFWFRAGYDPGHMDLYDAAGNTIAAYAALKTLTGFWVQPTSIASWSSAGGAGGSIAALSGGNRVAIVWNDGSGVPIQSLGLNIASAHDQDGNTLPSGSNLTAAPVFLRLAD